MDPIDSEVEAGNPVSTLYNNLRALQNQEEVCFIESVPDTKFYGYCDGLLDDNELYIIKTVLGHQDISEGEAT